ncbi:MAG TPA: RagB/SusD family nutrient uptake outer membrane protein [Niabella sp.]|nr:RagB/SusD family nutrient uptake outer membrane protein [Niabella sp.]
MKKCILYNIIGVMLISMMPSCKKMLDVPDNLPGQLVTDLVFTDSIGAVNGVVGIYNQAFIGNSPLNGDLSFYPSLSADDIISSSTFYQPLFNNQLTPGDESNKTGMTGRLWNGLYGNTMIYQTNAVIEALGVSKNISASLKNQLTGECEFVRALSYFYLTNLYGAVPLALSSDYKVNNRLPRSTPDQVYEQIIKDLTSASSRLTVNYPSVGRARPNKHVALALLSRVYLYREQFQKADSLASIIINAGPYSMETVDRVFVVGNNEAIWQGLITGFYNYATGDGSTFVPYAGTIPTYILRDTLLNSFESGDLRKTQWLGFNTVNGIQYYYPFKYKNAPFRQVNGRVEAQMVFRLAEQYLIRAETRIKLGNLDGAADDIYAVRGRSGLARPTVITSDALMKAVIHERQTEFFCEWGHRWLDLKRWGILNTTMNAVKPNLWPVDGHSAIYPISYEQMFLNPGWLQNPGYN